ncbi:TRAP transporter large permease subunit [Sneathiella chungangensis]|uniref:TRAP transporter large permease subunit n=1 Tax=Sneathiella chungangensis TaxID=1418234 RepID=A0A845MCY6_9PROT|nr:SLC13 family permease [Sneathiella chungangensis]MZR21541.1 TRAP transporter large permease subunit [Sneathiella chungangensis]
MEVAGSVFHIWVVFAFIVVAIIFFANERIELEISSIGIIAGLLLLFHFYPVLDASGKNLLTAQDILAGIADPALITVLALLVVGQGIVRTGALEQPIRRLVALRRHHPVLAIAVVLSTVLLISAFMNNTPVVVIFIPLMTALAERLHRSTSTLMIPLSYASILGGMTTLIGSSTNLLVMAAAVQAGQPQITFFEFTVPGAVLAVVGLLYALIIIPRILPDRASMKGEVMDVSGKQFIVQMEVAPDSPLVGEQAVAGQFPSLRNITIRFIQRGEHILLPPFDGLTLKPADAVVFAGTRKSITEAFADNPQILQGFLEPDSPDMDSASELKSVQDQTLAEAVVAPASRMIGRALYQISFHYRTRCVVVGIQRRSRMIRTSRMTDIRLEAGDVLLLLGKRSDIMRLRNNPDVLLLEWSARELPATALAWRARVIFGAVVVLAATGVLPIVVAAVCGATAMVVSGCLNVYQASRSIDRRILLLIGAALGLGAAMQATGGASYLAHAVLSVMMGAGPAVILSAFFLLVAIFTNILSNNATAVLFTPIGISIAHELGIDPMIFAYTVIFAANCSFATPIGYQTNLLVMGPGHYKFSDYFRAGAPLVLLLWIIFSVFAPIYYGLM